MVRGEERELHVPRPPSGRATVVVVRHVREGTLPTGRTRTSLTCAFERSRLPRHISSLLPVFCIVLLLAACTPLDASGTNYFTGSQGLVLEYDEQFPASETYETDPLPVVLTLKNLGAVDVPYSKILISFAYDPLYINGTKIAKLQGNKLFYGRSPYYPSGDLEVFDFYDFRANKIVGLREAPETQLSAQLCYEYNTTFTAQVCVDVDQFLRSGKPQSCTGEEVTSSSQGAPVAITSIEPRSSILNQGAGGVAVRPDFVLHLQNVGTGMVLGPPQTEFEKACSLGYAPEQLNTVAIRAQVFGIELECKPRLVRLRDNEGIARCTVPLESERVRL